MQYNQGQVNTGRLRHQFSKVGGWVVTCDIILSLIKGFIDLVAAFDGDITLRGNTPRKQGHFQFCH
jgi:hypothetical protein